jgi:NAD(P)-dependent dehydrogenase (short-subunit alcohol dehydrogenase family)
MIKDGVKGKVVNICSIGGFVALPNLMHYQASKGAVVMITRSSALELAPYGINVNAVAPGPVRTPLISDRYDDPEMLQWLLDRIPLGRVAEPEEVVKAVQFLASDDASYATGSILALDGGWMIQ